VAGLVLSVNPSLTGNQVQDILKQSADDLGTQGWDSNYGWGRVNAANAVALAGGSVAPPPPPPPPPAPGPDTTRPVISITSPTAGSLLASKVTITVNASDNLAVTRVECIVDAKVIGRSTTSPFSFNWDTRNLSRGAHYIRCKAFDAAGNMGASSTVKVYK
jgi:hypothetical protein